MLLGLDLGTTNVKAVVTDFSGQPVARGSCPVRLVAVPGGGVEQDIEEIWDATLKAIRQAVQPIEPAKIEAIGISSQGGAMQILDDRGAAVGAVISWLDQRGRPFDERANQELGLEWFRQRIYHRGSWLALGQLLRLRQEQPTLLRPPNRVAFVGDIIVSRLCGRAAHDGTSAGLTLLYNPSARTYDPDVLSYLGVGTDQLPELTSPRETAGGLLPNIARATGLKSGIPVSAAVHDQYASALGTGAVRAGTVMIGTGTAWVLLAVSQELPVPIHTAFVCRHVIEGLCGQILSMVNGGSALNWAMDFTGQESRNCEGIDQLLEACAPGSEGLIFWPFLTSFDPAALAGTKGRLIGLQLSHQRPHLVRAVVEGLACELARHLDLLRESGLKIEELVVGGGAAGSRVTPQILADVTGLPLQCYGGLEASVLGAAILARGLQEQGTPLDELALKIKPPGKKVDPGKGRDFYEQMYRRYLDSLPSPT